MSHTPTFNPESKESAWKRHRFFPAVCDESFSRHQKRGPASFSLDQLQEYGMLGSSIQPAWERGSADSRPAGLSHRRHRDRIPLPPIQAGIPAGPAGSEQKTPFLNDEFSVTAQTSPAALPAAFLPGKVKDAGMEKTPCGLCNRHGALEGIDVIKTSLFLYFFLIFIHMACTVPEAPRE